TTGGTPTSTVASVTYDPAVSSRPLAVPRRHFDVTIGPASGRMDITVDLPRDDPRALDLVAGRTHLPGFIREVFGDLNVSNVGGASFFTDVQPTISVDATSIHVSAHSNASLSRVPLTDVVALNTYGGGFPNDVNDSFTVRVRGYRFTS